jgi:heme exporter protein D
MSDFLAMGGYAAYVWGSYGLAALIVLGLILTVLRRHAGARAAVAELEARRPRRSRVINREEPS